MSDSYNSEDYTNVCRNCLNDTFSRRREVSEIEVLTLDNDGRIYVEDTDLHVQDDEWTYYCDHCYTSSTDIDEILLERDIDEDDDEAN